jgi:hypothetical protein
MKKILSLAFVAAIFSSSVGSATVLVGFYAFDSGSEAPEAADFSTSGFSAVITKNTNTNGTGGGGSNDNTYGDSSIPVEGAATDNGVYRMYNGTTTITTTYSSAATGSYQLTSFLVDIGTTTTPIGTFSFSYSINGAAPVLLTSSPVTLSNVGSGYTNFPDFGVSFPNAVLNPGDSIVINMTIAGGSARMDNIAITGELIPEPSALLISSLGLVPLLRRRRTFR